MIYFNKSNPILDSNILKRMYCNIENIRSGDQHSLDSFLLLLPIFPYKPI